MARPFLTPQEDEKRLLWRLRTHGPQPRSDLARALGLSNSAITKLARNLLSLHLVEEVEAGIAPDHQPGRGRPTVPLRISPHGGYAVGVAVHTGVLEIALVDYAGGVICLTSEKIDPPEPQAFARMVDKRIHELAIEHRLLGTRLLGVGLSAPGPALSRDGNRWSIVHNLPGWRDAPLRDIMSRTLHQSVWIENDATAAALAEYYLGGLIDRCSTAIVITLGYGIGAGIIHDGRLLRGEVGSAGEIGMFYPSDAPRPSPVDLLSTLATAGCTITSIADFEEQTLGFEPIIEAWLDRAAGQLRLAVNSAIAWFDPGAIRLTSPLPMSVVQRLADRLNHGLLVWGDHRRDCEVGSFPIDVSHLGGASAVLGAALLPIHASLAAG
ncbi:MAG: ROK family transcriptional regulator [Sphingomonadales bacterium]|nr:ROK family transcriptional regulator [Sphingomonadales bacterium]MDE2171048.1 ROK family transcriptional regulator [Sphingomonadales bacterium]